MTTPSNSDDAFSTFSAPRKKAEQAPTPETSPTAVAPQAPNAAAPQPTPPQQPAPQPIPPTSGSASAPAPNTAADVSDNKAQKKPVRIGERLIDLGLISLDQLQIALTEQKASKRLLGETLIELGFITDSALGEVLAESSGAQRFDVKSAVLDTALIKLIPKEIALRHKVIAVRQTEDDIHLAMNDVYNVLALDQVRRYFPKNSKVIPVFSTEAEILELIDQYYDYEMTIDGILREIETGIRDKSTTLDGMQEGYVNPTVRLVDALLVDAIKQGTSDIHLEPEGSFVRVRYRIDGQLVQVRSFHNDYWSAIIVRVKIMSGMNIAETRNPQDGRISYNVLGREIDFRVATQPTVHGENIVLRLLDKKKALVPLEKLGFNEHHINLLKKLLKRPEGIVIVTGPTGSGKSTTLYSVLQYINSMTVNIMTLEDPVEYQLPLIRQTQIRDGVGMDFVSGIKSLMRQDPDIIFVGEVRDKDTALMSVRASLTGHQVFTTLHTNDALGAIPRLVDIGVPEHLLAGSIICCMAQRLARRLCDHCKQARLATTQECHILNVDPDNPPTIYEPLGCTECNHKGYKGRIAIVEILKFDKGLDEMVAESSSRSEMMEHALEHGFIRMAEDGIDKVLLGYIDLEELIRRINLTDRL